MFKRILEVVKLLFIKDSTNYIRKLGVNVGKNTKFVIYPYFWSYPKLGSEPYLITIGNNTLISADVTFLTHDGSINCFKGKEDKYKNIVRFGRIVIGDNCFIGYRALIMPNVRIGNDCVIAAGSIVTKNVPDGEVWGGVPAHFISYTKELGEKFLKETPEYNINNLTKNKKEEVINIVNCIEREKRNN